MLVNIKLQIVKNNKYFIVLTIIITLAIVESRRIILQIPSYMGQGEFNYNLLPFSLKEKFHYLPLLILDSLSLPTPYAIGLLSTFYHALGALFMFLFAKEYLKRAFPGESIPLYVPCVAMLTYAFYPYNIIGDAFPTLILVRSLMPLSLLLLMKSINNKSYTTLLAASSVLAIMNLADPRSIFFLALISFCIILIPALLLTSKKCKLKLLFVYLLYLVIASALSGVELIYRLLRYFANASTLPTVVTSTFNLNSFVCNFWYTTPLEIMRGLSFLATYIFFEEFEEEYLSVSFGLVRFCQLFIFMLAVSVPPLYLKRGNTAYRVYSMSTLTTLMITILLFSNFTFNRELSLGSLPILPRLLFYIINPKTPDIFKSFTILFRTARFLNFVCSMSISLLIGAALKIIAKTGVTLSLELSFSDRVYYRTVVKLTRIATTLILINILVWSLPVITLGTGPTRPHPSFEVSDRTMAYSNIVSRLRPYPATERTVSLHSWAGGLPHPYFLHGVEAGIKQFLIRYAVDSYFSPILHDSDYEFMAEIIEKLGVKYVILDGYKMDSEEFDFLGEELNASPYFEFEAKSGRLSAFKILNYNPITITSSGIFVLGGLEDYRTVFSLLQEQTNDTVVPVFMDSTLDIDTMVQAPFPLLVTPHKSILDLTIPFIIPKDDVIIVTPARWTMKWDRFKNWSPGYITDTIGGDWSCILPHLPNYEWSYSYRPDYGYAWIINAHDVLTIEFSSKNDTYYVMMRVLMSPSSGTIRFKIDNSPAEAILTKWDYNSSEFIWINLGAYNLNDDRHTLNIENVEGVNAINLILIVPKKTMEQALNQAQRFIEDRDVIYLIDLNKQYEDIVFGFSQTSINIIKEDTYRFFLNAKASRLFNVSLNQREISSGQTIKLSKGTYQLQVQLPWTVFATSFEKWNNSLGVPDPWSLESPWNVLYKGLLDPSDKVHGNYSYALITNTTNPGTWSWVKSPPIPVRPDAEYIITTHMKWFNVRQSHIVVEGVKFNGSTVRLTCLPYGKDGSSDWKEFRSKIIIPADVKEIVIILNAGWVYNASRGSAITWFDAISVQEVTHETDKSVVLFYTSEKPLKDLFISNSNELEIINTQINVYDNAYCEYSVILKAKGQVIIVIPEVFDGAWQIEGEKHLEINKIPAYYILSGFYINSENTTSIKLLIYNFSNRLLRLAEYTTFSTIGLIIVFCIGWNIREWLKDHRCNMSVKRIRRIYKRLKGIFLSCIPNV